METKRGRTFIKNASTKYPNASKIIVINSTDGDSILVSLIDSVRSIINEIDTSYMLRDIDRKEVNALWLLHSNYETLEKHYSFIENYSLTNTKRVRELIKNVVTTYPNASRITKVDKIIFSDTEGYDSDVDCRIKSSLFVDALFLVENKLDYGDLDGKDKTMAEELVNSSHSNDIIFNKMWSFAEKLVQCDIATEAKMIFTEKLTSTTDLSFAHNFLETVKGITSFGLDILPGIGIMKSLAQLITGYDLITHEEVNRLTQAIGIIIPYEEINMLIKIWNIEIQQRRKEE